MATQSVVVTEDTWINLVTEFSLVVGTSYIVQNISGHRAYLTELATPPDDDSPKHTISAGKSKGVIPASGIGLYVKGVNSNIIIVVTESN